MYNYNDVLTLARAGFNAQQIGALMQLGQTQTVQQTQAQPVQQTETLMQTGPAQPVQQTVQTHPGTTGYYDPYRQQMDELMRQVTGLTRTLQFNSIANSNQPQQETTEDVLASIINPPGVEGGGRDDN